MVSRIKPNDAEITNNVYDSSLFEHREVRICMGQLDWRLSTSEVEQSVKNGVALRFTTNFQIKILVFNIAMKKLHHVLKLEE